MLEAGCSNRRMLPTPLLSATAQRHSLVCTKTTARIVFYLHLQANRGLVGQ